MKYQPDLQYLAFQNIIAALETKQENQEKELALAKQANCYFHLKLESTHHSSSYNDCQYLGQTLSSNRMLYDVQCAFSKIILWIFEQTAIFSAFD